jgi:hypothetical protein
VLKIYFTSPYVRLCIATVIAIISSISAIHIATSAHQEPALRSQYIHEGTSVQPRSRGSIAGRLNERTENATFPNHIKDVCLDLTTEMTVV